MGMTLGPDELKVLAWLAEQKAPPMTPERRKQLPLPEDIGSDVSEWTEDFALLSDLPEELRPNAEKALRVLDDEGAIVARVSWRLDPSKRLPRAPETLPVTEPWSCWFSPVKQDQCGLRWEDLLAKVRRAWETLEADRNGRSQRDAEEELPGLRKLTNVQNEAEVNLLRARCDALVEQVRRLWDVHVRVTEAGRAALSQAGLQEQQAVRTRDDRKPPEPTVLTSDIEGVGKVVVDEQSQTIRVDGHAIPFGGARRWEAFLRLWKNRPRPVDLRKLNRGEPRDVASDVRAFLRSNGAAALAERLKSQRGVGHYFDIGHTDRSEQ
jgi:hypothetical protein